MWCRHGTKRTFIVCIVCVWVMARAYQTEQNHKQQQQQMTFARAEANKRLSLYFDTYRHIACMHNILRLLAMPFFSVFVFVVVVLLLLFIFLSPLPPNRNIVLCILHSANVVGHRHPCPIDRNTDIFKINKICILWKFRISHVPIFWCQFSKQIPMTNKVLRYANCSLQLANYFNLLSVFIVFIVLMSAIFCCCYCHFHFECSQMQLMRMIFICFSSHRHRPDSVCI